MDLLLLDCAALKFWIGAMLSVKNEDASCDTFFRTVSSNGITASNSSGCAVRRCPVFLQNSTISLCCLRLSASLFFQQWSLHYRLRNWQMKAASLPQCKTFIVIVAEKNKDVQALLNRDVVAT
ncbi:unnamed protein product [Malus baccata var. baccata]